MTNDMWQVHEIHVKEFFNFKRNYNVGVALNSTQAENSAFVFLVKSIKYLFKEGARTVPVDGANAVFLHTLPWDVSYVLEKICYWVLWFVTENNIINRNAMTLFKNSMDNEETSGATTRLLNKIV